MNCFCRWLFFSWLMMAGVSLYSQSLTISPYSRYAIGDILNNLSTRNAAMGGIGVASDNYFSINFANPAGYADLLFTTFDVSAFGQLSNVSTASNQSLQFNGGLQNLAFGFPPNRGPKLVIGFSPYSTVGYNLVDRRTLTIRDTLFTRETNYRGEGGLNQFFIGLGGSLLKKRLRLGANVAFRFGSTRYEWENRLFVGDSLSAVNQAFQRNSVVQDIYTQALMTQPGFIYQDTLAQDPNILFRLGGSAELTLRSQSDRFTVFDNTLVQDSLSGRELGEINFPTRYNAGVNFSRPGKWSVGAEFMYQDWSQFSTFGDQADLTPEYRISLGGEFAPDPESFRYVQRIKYRFGAFYRQTYIQVEGEPVLDYGLTLGIGLPASLKGNNRFNRGRAASRINLSAELGRRGNLSPLPLEELYVRFRLGVNINDTWFIKRVVD